MTWTTTTLCAINTETKYFRLLKMAPRAHKTFSQSLTWKKWTLTLLIWTNIFSLPCWNVNRFVFDSKENVLFLIKNIFVLKTKSSNTTVRQTRQGSDPTKSSPHIGLELSSTRIVRNIPTRWLHADRNKTRPLWEGHL